MGVVKPSPRAKVAAVVKSRFAKVGAYRSISLVLGAASGTLSAFVIVEKFGASGFAIFALLSALLTMLPFADLGLGVAVLNASSDCSAGRISNHAFEKSFSSVRALLTKIALTLIAADLAVAVTIGWPSVLGLPQDPATNVACGAVLALLAVSIPLGTGARALQGSGKMHLVTKVAILNPLLQIACVIPVALIATSASQLAVLPAVAFLLVALLTDRLGRRQAGGRLKFFCFSGASGFHVKAVVGQSASFLVISIGLTVGLQFQRILVSHLSTASALAEYSLIMQYLLPTMSVIGVIAQALWPTYRSRIGYMGEGDLGRHVLIFGLLGFFGGALLVVSVTVVSRWLLSGAVAVSLGTCLCAVPYLIAFALHQPSAMLLTSKGGLLGQAVLVTVMAGLSVGLTLALVPRYGVGGALVALSLSIFLAQLWPTFLAARRYIRLSRLNTEVFAVNVGNKEA